MESMLNRSFDKAASRLFSPLLLLALLAAIAIDAFSLLYSPDYTIGDWLINYSGGFVRRGLPGAVLLSLSHVLHLQVPWLAFAASTLLYATLVWGIYRLTQPLRRSFWLYALVFSPAALPFVILNADNVGFRKETMLLAALALFCLFVRKQWSNVRIAAALLLIFVLVVLSHEATIVCFPYFFAATALLTGSLARSLKICVVPFVAALVLFVVVSHFPGGPQAAHAICSSIGGQWAWQPGPTPFPEMGDHASLCSGSITWMAVPLAFYRAQHDQMNSLGTYLRLLPLILLPFVIALGRMFTKDKLRSQVVLLTAVALVCFAGSFELFLNTIDWGRWIYTQTMCLMMVTLLLARQSSSATLPLEASATPAWQRGLLGLGTLVFCTTWAVPVNALMPYKHGYNELRHNLSYAIPARLRYNAAHHAGRFGEPLSPNDPVWMPPPR